MITEMETGTVLHRWECNGYDDSDFFEAIWTGEAIVAEETGSTRFAGRFYSRRPGPDAAQDDAARNWACGELTAILTASAIAQSIAPRTGVQVVSVAKTGKNKGLTGTVTGIETNKWDTVVAVVAMDGLGETRTITASTLQVINPVPLYSKQQVAARAAHLASRPWPEVISALGLRDKHTAVMR